MELIEGKVEAEVEVEEADTTMIVGINNNIISIKRVNFKEEAEDMAATTQQLIAQSQHTNFAEKEEEVFRWCVT